MPQSFFLSDDVAGVARALLGKMLCTRIAPGGMAGGVIVETEAYGGVDDRASHAYGGRRTARTEVMYAAGGVAYVYLCYGMHHLFNIITNRAGVPHAVLVRALEPRLGVPLMCRRRRKSKVDRTLCGGPGALTKALGITLRQNGVSVVGDTIWLEEGMEVTPDMICSAPRIGVDYAGADAHRPWRFYIKHNPWVSRP